MIDSHWLTTLQNRGLLGAVRTLLDLLEPVGPIGAQLLFIAQPMTRFFGDPWPGAVGAVARALEHPDTLAALREQIDALDAVGHAANDAGADSAAAQKPDR